MAHVATNAFDFAIDSALHSMALSDRGDKVFAIQWAEAALDALETMGANMVPSALGFVGSEVPDRKASRAYAAVRDAVRMIWDCFDVDLFLNAEPQIVEQHLTKMSKGRQIRYIQFWDTKMNAPAYHPYRDGQAW